MDRTHFAASPEKEKLARAQGDAYDAALAEMKKEDVHASIEAEEYVITFVAEKAEGMYAPSSATDLSWHTPDDGANVHIEVAVQDRYDHRFLPQLDVECTLVDEAGNIIGTKMQPFLWHPFLFHYGANWHIPGSGLYRARIVVRQPAFHRHDEKFGKRYERTVEVELGPIDLPVGQKPHGPE
ncbi:MAG TPA: hypothetical protein VHA78_03155 [Candidatus Peribacteraceae bacterium]|nr:hypothetical protein [Candidatus Peribacteraceae bacterium]